MNAPAAGLAKRGRWRLSMTTIPIHGSLHSRLLTAMPDRRKQPSCGKVPLGPRSRSAARKAPGKTCFFSPNRSVSEALTRYPNQHLEVFETWRSRSRQGSLLDALDCTVTPSGTRRLGRWLRYPLKELTAIEARLDGWNFFEPRPAAASPAPDPRRAWETWNASPPG